MKSIDKDRKVDKNQDKLNNAKKSYNDMVKRMKPYIKPKSESKLVKHSKWEIASNNYICKST